MKVSCPLTALASVTLGVAVNGYITPTIPRNRVAVNRVGPPCSPSAPSSSRGFPLSLQVDDSVRSLLDGEQEKTISDRADIEEGLLRDNQNILTMATEEEIRLAKKRVTKVINRENRGLKAKKGASKGFGAAAPSSDAVVGRARFRPTLDSSGLGSILQEEGVARINGALSPETAAGILAYSNRGKEDAERAIEAGEVPKLSRFANVLLKKNRWDLLLPFGESDDVMRGLDELLGEGGVIGTIIEATLGNDAELYELACLISDPLSQRQVIHPDIAHQEGCMGTGPLITCFVALQDIDEVTGPTVFLPRTNTAEHHKGLKDHSARDEMLSKTSSSLSTLNAGDCSIFDAMSLHAGSANKSEKRRVLFYFTFRDKGMSDPRTSNNPGSIRPELKAKKITLKDMRKELNVWKNRTS